MADETYLQQNPIDEDELDLTLGLPVRPVNYSYLPCEARYSQNVVETSNGQITEKREQQETRGHEGRVKRDLKRKASLCFNSQNGVVIEENREENSGEVVKLGFQLMGGNAGSFQAYKGYNGHSGVENRASVSSGGNSSGVSDNYQSNSAAGGNSSDSSSHSSQPHMDFSASDSKHAASSSEQEPTPLNTRQCSKSPETNPSPKDGQVVTGQPPKANGQSCLVAQMPRVITTGNGPQGKTITGFLYKYTKMEVSIVCVCHGASFSPAGFVKHAGGVDVEHPLKHIRISPFSRS